MLLARQALRHAQTNLGPPVASEVVYDIGMDSLDPAQLGEDIRQDGGLVSAVKAGLEAFLHIQHGMLNLGRRLSQNPRAEFVIRPQEKDSDQLGVVVQIELFNQACTEVGTFCQTLADCCRGIPKQEALGGLFLAMAG